MFLRILTIFIIFFISVEARSEIIINNFDQTTELINSGRKVKATLQAVVKNLPPHSLHSGFTITFSGEQNTIIADVKFNSKTPKYTFKNNELAITFDEGKMNNERFSLSYSYIREDKNIDKHLRKEAIFAPVWAKGAKAKIILNIGANFDVISLNKNIKKIGNQLYFEGQVPESGFAEIIQLTPKSTIWNVQVKSSVTSQTNLIDLEAKIPVYFFNGGQKNDNNFTTSTPDSSFGFKAKDLYILKYNNVNISKVDILISSIVSTGTLNQQLIMRDPRDYLAVSKSDWLLLGATLVKIRSDPTLQYLPLYAKIGFYVHDYIKYDKSYVGKLLSNASILSLQKGVCTEYAQLYNTLARMAGIPSQIINGIAKGEYDEFEGHSWNLIYINNKWQQVDATWNLMSGNVSSSHIYFYDNGAKSIEASWKEKQDGSLANVVLTTDFQAKEIILNKIR